MRKIMARKPYRMGMLFVVVVAAILVLVAGSALAAGALVDINTADQKTLESLPGVGPATAKEIVKGRPYKSVDDLANVKGIGKSKLEKIKPLVTVGGQPAAQAPAAAGAAAGAAAPAAASKATTATQAAQKAPAAGEEGCQGRHARGSHQHQHGFQGAAGRLAGDRQDEGAGHHRRAAVPEDRGHHEGQGDQAEDLRQDQGPDHRPVIRTMNRKEDSR